jgi:hypothetical protein
LTVSDEFHSVIKTGNCFDLNHLPSSLTCVDFPDPSIPSTTISLPFTSNFLECRDALGELLLFKSRDYLSFQYLVDFHNNLADDD